MSITPSPCGYIVTTKLNCSLEKGRKKKPICHNGVNESTDHCNVLFWVFFFVRWDVFLPLQYWFYPQHVHALADCFALFTKVIISTVWVCIEAKTVMQADGAI